MFPLEHQDDRVAPKELVMGVLIKGIAKAYPISKIQDFKSTEPLKDTVAGESIYIYSGVDQTAYVTDSLGELLPATRMYWFAWSAFYPQSLLYQKDN